MGIDYGRGMTNINPETGIRFGIIPMNDVVQAWCDSSEPYYGEPTCPKCGEEITDPEDQDTYYCKKCDYQFYSHEAFGDEPLCFHYDDEGYEVQSDDHGDLWIIESPYFTYADFCSPCAPGACHLRNIVEPNDNNKCYCFGHDWFDEGKAPYPVYDVKTGKEVNSEND